MCPFLELTEGKVGGGAGTQKSTGELQEKFKGRDSFAEDVGNLWMAGTPSLSLSMDPGTGQVLNRHGLNRDAWFWATPLLSGQCGEIQKKELPPPTPVD